MLKANPNLVTRHGARLPHWTVEGATYAVTFRLADSLPSAVLHYWKFERQDIIQTARKLGRPLTAFEEARLDKLFSEKIDKYLGQGRGKCWMLDSRIAAIVAGALECFDGARYGLRAWCVMPNHVHVVTRPEAGHSLAEILHSWKSYTAKEANRLLKRTGRLWEVEYYDHLIRDDHDLSVQVNYVLTNPKVAGLRDWQWVGLARASRP